jgi:Co/Zn/Cd efflux system component
MKATATAWPDLAVAFIMAGLFLNSSAQILWQSWNEWKAGGAEALARKAEEGCTSCSTDRHQRIEPHAHATADGHDHAH